MYDLENSDTGREWVELFNEGTDVDLTNWRFEEGGMQHTLTLKQGNSVMSNGQYVVIVDDYTKFLQDYPGFSGTVFDSTFSLLNTEENLKIRDSSNGNIINEVTYTSSQGASGDGNSLQRKSDGNWIAVSPTPDVQNASSLPASSPLNNSPSPAPSISSTTSTSFSFTISNIPSNINSDQSFSVSITLSLLNSQNTDYYLKGAFKIKDGTRYLGLTKVNGDWIEYGDDNTDQYKITTDSSGNWSGSIDVKPDVNDKDYKGSGDYIFKVGRLTSSSSSPTWSNESNIQINTKEIFDKNSNTLELTNNSPTNKDSSFVVYDQDLSDEVYSLEKYRHIASIAGTATASPLVKVSSQKQGNFSPLIFLGGGLILAAFSYIIYEIIKHRKLKNDSL
ncbi:MAG: hypothetical protein HYW45_00825 [Candidatus Daviesbacteria bacterium]|nr:MAG: hypothetical protein HYW45_00825 [Candidatus Daviesbacteria bacterium]